MSEIQTAKIKNFAEIQTEGDWNSDIGAYGTTPQQSEIQTVEVGDILSITRFTKKITTIAIEMTLSNDVI